MYPRNDKSHILFYYIILYKQVYRSIFFYEQ